MKKIIITFLILTSLISIAYSQISNGGAGISYSITDPTIAPSAGRDRLVQNKINGKLWYWNTALFAWECISCNTSPSTNSYMVRDSAEFRSFNEVSVSYVIMEDVNRGGVFRECVSCTADQYMVFTDALGRKWERFVTDGRYNVKWFGAIGLQTQDERYYLQKAIDIVSANYGGGVIFMPNGVYNVSVSNLTGCGVNLRSNCTLEGEGWETVFRYTNPNITASAAIGSTSGNANQPQAVQDAGDVNISVKNLKIDFVNFVDKKGNGITLGGTVGGQIHNVWVNNCGGYSIHLVKNNDTASQEGFATRNVVVSDCRITGFGDTGVEFSGAINCTLTNTTIEGPGLSTAHGFAIIPWNGSQNITITNCTVKGTNNGISNGIIGVFVEPSYNPLATPNFRQTKNIIISNVIAENCNIGLIVGTDESGPIWGRCQNINISNCSFRGNQNFGYGLMVNNADSTLVSNCYFRDFSNTINVSSNQYFANQRNVQDLEIVNCKFIGSSTSVNEISGVNNLRFINNLVEATQNPVGIRLRGIRYGSVEGNIIKNCGVSGNTSAFEVRKCNGSSTRETRYVSFLNNRIIDDRTTPTLFFVTQFVDASDSCIVMGNDARSGKPGAFAFINVGTGTNIKEKDKVTGESYNSDLNPLPSNSALTTDASGNSLWILQSNLFSTSNGVSRVGNDIQLGRPNTGVGVGDRTADVFHNLRGFNDTWNTNVGTAFFVNGSTADIGVRTSNPLASFHIGGGGNFRLNDGFKFSTDGGNNAEFSSPSNLYFYSGIPIANLPSGTAELNITDNAVGVRTFSPTANFHTVGTVRHQTLPSKSSETKVFWSDIDGNMSIGDAPVSAEKPYLYTSSNNNIEEQHYAIKAEGHTSIITLTFTYSPQSILPITKEVVVMNIGTTHNIVLSSGTQTWLFKDLSGNSTATYTMLPGTSIRLIYDTENNRYIVN